MVVMGRVRYWWSHSKTVALIWFSSLSLFYFLFQMALRNSTPPSPAIWFQNSSLYHFSMFHASHHIVPVLASEVECDARADKSRSSGYIYDDDGYRY
ncbi:hypothetical protein V6N13_099447 [Hibiscus sabdariffa]